MRKGEMILDKTKEKFVFKHRYALLFFSFVVMYNWVVTNRFHLWSVSESAYAFHVVDFSFGIRSNILPGAVFYGLFGDHASFALATVYETLLLLVFFAGVSVLLEKLCHSVESMYHQSILILVFVFLSGPFTFAIFTNELGMLDFYWILCSLLFFFFIEKKYLCLLIPLLYVLCLAVHFSAVLNYLILFSVLLLYKASEENRKEKKRIYILVFVVSVSVSFVVFLYYLYMQAQDAAVSYDEFHRIMEERGSRYFIYYDYEFFNLYNGEPVVPSDIFSMNAPIKRLISLITAKIAFNMGLYANDISAYAIRFLFSAIFISPLMFFYYKYLRLVFRNSRNNRLKRVSLFFMMIQFPFTVIVGLLFSPDIIRWFTHGFLISYAVFLYLIYKETKTRALVFGKTGPRNRFLPASIYFLAYFMLTFWAYT